MSSIEQCEIYLLVVPLLLGSRLVDVEEDLRLTKLLSTGDGQRI